MSSSEPKNPGLTMRLLGRFSFFLAVILLLSWVHRITAMMIFYWNNRGFAWHYQPIDGFNPLVEFFRTYQQALLLGLKTDILFALPIAAILMFLGRWGGMIGAILLSGFYAANAEHIRFNESNIDIGQIGLAANPTFIAGQTTLSLFQTLLGFLAVAAMLFWFSRRTMTRRAIVSLTILMAATIGLSQSNARLDHPIWMQTHPALPMIANIDVPTDLRRFPEADFNQASAPISPIGGEYNVLLVFLEGLSENSLSLSDMSYLQALSQKHIHFSQYIGHQLLTSNGLYSALTGHLPYFTNVPIRWDQMTQASPETLTALPNVLRRTGYTTTFIQSAPLGFMQKDEKLPLLGYDRVLGANDMPPAYSQNGWGVDDLTLMEATLNAIDDHPDDQPWFTTVLTSGTHSPYNVPSDFMPESNRTGRYLASRFADTAIRALVDGLEERDLLKETVVIITSDESREYSQGTQLETDLHRSWLPFIVVHPDGLQAEISTPFAMIDVRNVVLAATGNVTPETFKNIISQREVFVAGNMRLKQVFHYHKGRQELFACNTDLFICHQYSDVQDLRDLSAITLDKIAKFPGLEETLRTREGAEVDCHFYLERCE